MTGQPWMLAPGDRPPAPATGGPASATGRIASSVLGNVDSHLDALAHVIDDATLGNGAPAGAVAVSATELTAAPDPRDTGRGT